MVSKYEGTPRKARNFRIPVDLDRQFEAIARRHDRDFTSEFVHMMREYIRQQEKKERESE